MNKHLCLLLLFMIITVIPSPSYGEFFYSDLCNTGNENLYYAVDYGRTSKGWYILEPGDCYKKALWDGDTHRYTLAQVDSNGDFVSVDYGRIKSHICGKLTDFEHDSGFWRRKTCKAGYKELPISAEFHFSGEYPEYPKIMTKNIYAHKIKGIKPKTKPNQVSSKTKPSTIPSYEYTIELIAPPDRHEKDNKEKDNK
jgi:hypothetical protein